MTKFREVLANSNPIEMPEPEDRKTGVFEVHNLFSPIYGGNPGYEQAMEGKAMMQIADRVAHSMKDGRQYSVKMERDGKTVPSTFGGYDRIDIHRVTILLVHPGDCEPGELAVAEEAGYDPRIRQHEYKVRRDIKGCVERVW